MELRSLEECRKQIDQIDSEIVSLIEKRMAVSSKIGKIKLQMGKAVFDPAREKEVLRSVSSRANSLAGRLAVEDIYSTVLDTSKKLQRLLSENIFLIGMPGAGKTTTGKELADLLGMHFTDADELFLEKYKKSAADCIISEGEEAFREKETECLKELCSLSGHVIALGGGVVTVEKNLELVRGHGRIVYLRCKPEALDTSGRPISQSKGVSEIVKVREPLYQLWADFSVERSSVEETCFRIAEQLFTVI